MGRKPAIEGDIFNKSPTKWNFKVFEIILSYAEIADEKDHSSSFPWWTASEL